MNRLIVFLTSLILIQIFTVNGSPIQSRITNGNDAEDLDFPWHVSVIGEQTNGLTQLCSGSLIYPDWILTAAHCVRGMVSLNIGLGSTNLSKPLINLKVYDYIIHQEYDNVTKNHDIALIPLSEPVELSSSIQTINLPIHRFPEFSYRNIVGRVSGFGRLGDDSPVVSQKLKWIYVRIIDNLKCQRTYGESVIVESTMCAVGLVSIDQNTCNGDSGGALVAHDRGRVIQVGVIAFAAVDQCTVGHPSGYMRVTSYLDWIEETRNDWHKKILI